MALPPIFVWLLFRRGYSKSLRDAALLYTGVNVALGLLGGH